MPMHRSLWAVLSSALLVAGMSGGARASTAPIPNRLYVSDASDSMILVYSDGSNPSLIGSITTGLSGPGNMNVDRRGNLYVANFGGDVTVYAPGTSKPSLTISSGLQHPDSVAIARDGTVYVGDLDSGVVQEYHPGATQPFLTIPQHMFPNSDGGASPADIAVDSNGNAYVSYAVEYSFRAGGNGQIVEYAPRHIRGTSLHVLSGPPAGIDLDSAGDIALGVQSPFSGSDVEVRGPGGHPTLDEWPDGEAAGALRIGSRQKEIYTTDLRSSAVNVYSYPAGVPLRTIQLTVLPSGLAVSPAHP